MVELARELRKPIAPSVRPGLSLPKIAAALAQRGYTTPSGRVYSPSAVASMIGE
jgi:hypothetical protein